MSWGINIANEHLLASIEVAERAIYIAPDDPIAASAINEWRAAGVLYGQVPVRTSDLIVPGAAFFSDGQGSGEIFVFTQNADD